MSYTSESKSEISMVGINKCAYFNIINIMDFILLYAPNNPSSIHSMQPNEDRTPKQHRSFTGKPIQTIFSLSNFLCHARIQRIQSEWTKKITATTTTSNHAKPINNRRESAESSKKKRKIKYIMHIIISFPYSVVGLFSKRYFCAAFAAATAAVAYYCSNQFKFIKLFCWFLYFDLVLYARCAIEFNRNFYICCDSTRSFTCLSLSLSFSLYSRSQ